MPLFGRLDLEGAWTELGLPDLMRAFKQSSMRNEFVLILDVLFFRNEGG